MSVGNQMSLFDADILCGKMSSAPSVPEPPQDPIFKQSLKKSAKLSGTTAPLYLSLRMGGLLQETSMEWVMTELPLAYAGEYMMLNSGESPNDAVESRLSQILEAHPHPKYSLSPTACRGILNRAQKRGKELPEILQVALERQAMEAPQNNQEGQESEE